MMFRSLLFAVAVIVVLSFNVGNVDAAIGLPQPMKTQWHYYKITNTCRDVEEYVKHQVKLSWDHDKSITPKLLRLLYSDCFATGCDASVLLAGPASERTAPQNRGLGGFALIDKIKAVVEARCPGVVSCSDILNLATRDAVHLAGAPSYPVFTGRRDGMSSNAASVDLPSPSISLEQSLSYFQSKGLDVLDMTTLLGAHSMGSTHCRNIEDDRLYNYNNTGKQDPSMKETLLTDLRKRCPLRTRKGQGDPLVFLNPESGNNYKFSNSYYSRVLSHEAVLGVDQQLVYGEDTKQISQEFADVFEDFRKSFALSMNRLGNINVLTGNQGEIRRHCQYTNKDYAGSNSK